MTEDQPFSPSSSTGEAKSASLALTSMILGIFSMFGGVLTGLPAVICGHMARGRIKRGVASGDGFALTGLITGYLFSFLNTVLLVIVAYVITFMVHNKSDCDTEGLIKNELKFAKSSTYILGEYLATAMPNAKVLVIVGQKNEYNKRQKVLIDGLKEGFGSSMGSITIAAPKIKRPKGPDGKPMPDMMMPMEEMMKASDFNKLIAKHKSCNLIITLIGLPMDTGNLKIWKRFISDPKKTPKLCIVNGDVSMFGAFIAKGLMPAVVTFKPDAKYTENPAPKDMQKAFDKRYLLVTTKNVKEIAKKYKDQIFRKAR